MQEGFRDFSGKNLELCISVKAILSATSNSVQNQNAPRLIFTGHFHLLYCSGMLGTPCKSLRIYPLNSDIVH